MKVLHIIPGFGGGAGLCCLRLHKALTAIGVNSSVLVAEDNTGVDGIYEFGKLKYRLWRLFGKISDKMGFCSTDYDRIRRLSRDNGSFYTLPISVIDVSTHPLVQQADVIHLHWINGFVDYPSFFRKVNKPIVWTLHDENLFFGIAHYAKDYLKDNDLERKYYKIKFDAIHGIKKLGIVFLSKMMFAQYKDHEMVAGRPMTVINNAVNCSDYTPMDKVNSRRHFGIAQDAIVFVFVAGSISDKRKGLGLLTETLLRMNVPNAVVLAVGNVAGDVNYPLTHTVGIIKDSKIMSMAYSCADYFVMPSVQEAFAQTPLEAMACGIPAIVFPVSGTSELIRPMNGVRCNGFTSLDLEKGIYTAMNTSYDGKAIRSDVMERFSPQVIGKEYVKFYQSMI